MMTPIVFDMDGVLADTEPLKFRAHGRALRSFGGELSRELYRREMGGVHEDVIRAFLAASEVKATAQTMANYEARFQESYRELLEHELSPCEGARELLDACRRGGRLVALVTSSERWMADRVLDGLGAVELFETVITADDVERQKPDPEPYRRARSALGGSTSRPAVAVEDTPAGLASATAAGLPVIVVVHRLNRDADFPGASAVVESLAPADRFLDLVDAIAGA